MELDGTTCYINWMFIGKQMDQIIGLIFSYSIEFIVHSGSDPIRMSCTGCVVILLYSHYTYLLFSSTWCQSSVCLLFFFFFFFCICSVRQRLMPVRTVITFVIVRSDVSLWCVLCWKIRFLYDRVFSCLVAFFYIYFFYFIMNAVYNPLLCQVRCT